MKRHVLGPSLILMALVLYAALPIPALAEERREPSRSLDVSISVARAYKDAFGGAGTSYAPMLTYSYLLNRDYLLGIVLIRFNHFYEPAQNLYGFAYGFLFKHFLPKPWADLGPLVPWCAYGILLNQLVVSGTDGRGMAHDTRISAGLDWIWTSSQRITAEIVWDYASFPAFNDKTARDLQLLSAGIGYRFLF